MASLKQLSKKIVSLKAMRKITRAMKMIAATKLRRAQDALGQSAYYEKVLKDFVGRIASCGAGYEHPLYRAHKNPEKIRLIVFAADRGLCGSFNNAIIRKAEAFCKEKSSDGKAKVTIDAIGKRSYEAFKNRGWPIANYYEGVRNAPTYSRMQSIADSLMKEFSSDTIDEVHLIYSDYRSAISQVPVFKQLLPLLPEESCSATSGSPIIEPDPDLLLQELAKRSVSFMLYRSLVQSVTSEHAARMAAMDAATGNTEDLIDRFTLQRNKVRQAAITRELVEIVSGAESL